MPREEGQGQSPRKHQLSMRRRRYCQWTESSRANEEGREVTEVWGRVYFNENGIVNYAVKKKGKMKANRSSLNWSMKISLVTLPE